MVKEKLISSMCRELELQRDYLGQESVETIYFGGGTPSLLSENDFITIFSSIEKNYNIHPKAEITLEVNPDDLNEDYIKILLKLSFNRISIGIQSFNDNELSFLRRRHTAIKATKAVKLCQDAGLSNISIDLIYGLPGQSIENWEYNIDKATSLSVQHISSYHLTYEKDTPLFNLLEKGDIQPIDEETSNEMFKLLNEKLKKAGYTRYEISNYAKDGFISQHNSSYWSGKKYLGIGPSAHSYNQQERSWNTSSIEKYVQGVKTNNPFKEIESLNQSSKYNDYLVTRLRTMWGADLKEIENLFGKKYLDFLLSCINRYISSQDIIIENGKLIITEKGLFISDRIISDCMYIQ